MMAGLRGFDNARAQVNSIPPTSQWRSKETIPNAPDRAGLPHHNCGIKPPLTNAISEAISSLVMKLHHVTLIVLGMLTCSRADLVVPKKVFMATSLAEATAKAKAEKKALAFVYGHIKTN
jgi:hypothetical protein